MAQETGLPSLVTHFLRQEYASIDPKLPSWLDELSKVKEWARSAASSSSVWVTSWASLALRAPSGGADGLQASVCVGKPCCKLAVVPLECIFVAVIRVGMFYETKTREIFETPPLHHH